MKPRLIKAIDPADLLEEVSIALHAREDLNSPLFVSHEGLLCQWTAPTSLNINEYKLIAVTDLDALETQLQNLVKNGYDTFHHTVLWNNAWYLQWMQRMTLTNSTTVRELVKSNLFDSALQMVEDAQASLRLVPTGRGAHVVTMPYPVNVS